tara:strand:- start:3152 stop:4111 length:960 start_codon:yes stop_codon:yes gene_type:complete
MNILITGAAGFIGFNFSKSLLGSSNHKVVGIDNINDYYSVTLKKNRLRILKKFPKFSFYKIDINSKKKITNLFKKKKIDIVFNFAAQAGVRYSIENPRVFVDNNIAGFYNILEAATEHKVKKFFYASSSSVYGDNDKFPLKENMTLKPKNIYGLSKKINEEITEITSIENKIPMIGLRFFTIYGEWGRPDMFMIKYLHSSFNKKKLFYLNNNGNHVRDFTYIGDVCKILKKLIKFNSKKKHSIFNICSTRPVHLSKVLKIIDKFTSKKPIIKKRSIQKGDIYKTHGDNTFLKKSINFKSFTDINVGIKNTVDWYMKNKI